MMLDCEAYFGAVGEHVQPVASFTEESTRRAGFGNHGVTARGK